MNRRRNAATIEHIRLVWGNEIADAEAKRRERNARRRARRAEAKRTRPFDLTALLWGDLTTAGR